MRIDGSTSLTNIQPTDTKNIEVNNDELIKSKEKEFDEKENIQNEEYNFSDQIIEKAIEKANKALEDANRKIEREYHEKTNSIIFRIKDTETGEIIKEIPPEKFKDMIAKMWELAGLFVDEKA